MLPRCKHHKAKENPGGGVNWDNDNFQTLEITPAFLKILHRKQTQTKSQQTALLSMMPNFNNDNFIKDARLLRLEIVETTDQNS